MFLIYLARVLEWIFFIGLAGSLLVSVLAFVGDLHVFFEDDKEEDTLRSHHIYAPSSGDD
ncbi:MAG TPA: hypothetical protein VJV96_03885 [Candidatus Angelobacter sp.]|jgi:hypothetical protein|nr:hypothetical protein [Candidatus Angelobacter sp.]